MQTSYYSRDYKNSKARYMYSSDKVVKDTDSKAQNILVFLPMSDVDVTLCAKAINYLVKTYVKAEFTLIGVGSSSSLYAAMPRLKDIINVAEINPGTAFWLWKGLSKVKWDLLVDYRNTKITSLFRADKKIKLAKNANDKYRGHQYLRELVAEDESLPIIKNNIWIPGEAVRAADKKTFGHKQIISVAVDFASKTSEELLVWQKLISNLIADNGLFKNYSIAFMGGVEQKQASQDFMAGFSSDKKIDLIGGVSPLNAYTCLQKSDFFIGDNIELIHLAEVSKVLTCAVIDKSMSVQYAPHSDRSISLVLEGDMDNEVFINKLMEKATSLWNKYHR